MFRHKKTHQGARPKERRGGDS